MINENAMLVNVHVSMWEGRRLDKEASRKAVAEAEATDADALSVNKLLVTKESLAPLVTTRNAMRMHFLQNTLPWKDNGDRLLPRRMYQMFIEQHSALEQAFKDAVDHFLAEVYPREVDRADLRLNKAFNRDDYPSVSELRDRFRVRVDIDAITDANDFRVKMTEEDAALIKSQITDATEQRLHDAMVSVWERVVKTVEHFAKRMKAQTEDVAPGRRRSSLHATTLTNLQELVNVLPALNIIGDPDLKRMTKELQQRLCAYDVNDLKGKPQACAAAAKEADEIVDGLKGFFNAFKGA